MRAMYDDLYDEFDWDSAWDEAMCTMADYAYEDNLLEHGRDHELAAC